MNRNYFEVLVPFVLVCSRFCVSTGIIELLERLMRFDVDLKEFYEISVVKLAVLRVTSWSCNFDDLSNQASSANDCSIHQGPLLTTHQQAPIVFRLKSKSQKQPHN